MFFLRLAFVLLLVCLAGRAEPAHIPEGVQDRNQNLIAEKPLSLPQLLSELASEKFLKRQQAEEQLFTWAEADQETRLSLLTEQYRQSEGPEVRHRLESLLFNLYSKHQIEKIPRRGQGFIGVSLGPAQGQNPPQGAGIQKVFPGTPGEKAGVLVGDVITHLDGNNITEGNPIQNLIETVKQRLPGTPLKLTIQREGKELELTVILMNRQAMSTRRQGREHVDQEKQLQLLKIDFLTWLRQKQPPAAINPAIPSN